MPIKKLTGQKKIALVSAGLAILGLIAWGVIHLIGDKSKPVKTAPKITLMAPPPPPPPPPPPKVEKKPDPPKEQKEMKVAPSEPKQAPPQQAPELKMEGAAGDGPSAFAAGHVSSEDVSKLGQGKTAGEKSGMFNPFDNYANLIKGDLQRYLRKNNDLRQRHYKVEILVWVAANGDVKRSELLGSTGDKETDAAINQALKAFSRFDQVPPANMPQPVRMRIVTGT
jgi:protein TonB